MKQRIRLPYERKDSWQGWQPVYAESFATARRGLRETRWRLVAGQWSSHSSYSHREMAEMVARQHAMRSAEWRRIDPVAGKAEAKAEVEQRQG